jgi:hypothetical protein
MSMFVAEFDPTGACVWSKAFGTQTQNETLALDPMRNVVVAGGFYGTVNFGTGPLTAPGIGMDAFVAKFTGGGTLAWAKSFGSGASVAQVTGIGADGCGDILVDGTFSGTIDFGLGTLTESGMTGSGDIFLAKLDPSGSGIWSRSFGDPNTQLGGPLAIDGFGGPAITSGFSGAMDFGGGSLNGSPEGSTATYVAKFNSEGTYEWAYAGGPPSSTATNSFGHGIAASDSVVLTTGTLQGGKLSLAGDALIAASMQDTYLASFAR